MSDKVKLGEGDPTPLFGLHPRRPLTPDEADVAARHWSAWWDRRVAESGGQR
jgi:hypothetical protein